ncbi:hypothetical protein [Salinibaculum rarum]|uniref:hypothetical protein n=1 Tax=Salinibaculum rarum TaxID=3058903 RepID=UPI00265E7857|nr:hypothetical protein [Salinibaculum sp. KK48]
MSQSQSPRTEELADVFVAVTGDEEVTEPQDNEGDNRELRGESRIDEAVADGLDEAIEGMEADTGDPGEVSGG